MKSLKDYSLNLSEQEYHDYPAWSYSVIAKYAKDGFSALSTLHDKTAPTPSMEFGSLFDSILTKGRATLDEYVVDDTTCPPAEKNVFDTLIAKGHHEPFREVFTRDLVNTMEECGFYKTLKESTRLEKLEKASAYYENRRSGKKVVSSADWEDAIEMARIFRCDDYLKDLFGTKNTDDVEYIYQAQFLVNEVVEGEDVVVKFMPDLLVVNHKEKTIQPVDLKTSAMPAYDFASNFIKYRYDIQAEGYTEWLKTLIRQDAKEYGDYVVLPYLFTDISRTDKVPVTYKYDPEFGFSYTKGDRMFSYKGWRELLGEILVYEANHAKVPNYIRTDGPNDLREILNKSI